MKIVIKDKNVVRLNKIIDWLIYMVGYTFVLILVNSLFKSMYIDPNHSYLYSILIVLVIYVLNKTVKPILVTLTIPITGITLGLFYPFINLFILKLTDWLLGRHFQLHGLKVSLLIAILLSVMNFIVEEIIKNIIKKVKKYG